MTPSFIPLTLTLATLLLYGPILFNRPRSFVHTPLLWVLLILCGSVARLVPTLNALSTPSTSVAVLMCTTAFASALAILAVFLDVVIRARTGAIQAVLFPAIWATLWVTTSRLPLGRLTSWSPVVGFHSYGWMAPWIGPGGYDWLVAAWAVVISQTAGLWYMGSPESDEELSTTRAHKKAPGSFGTFILAFLLTVLAIPAFLMSSLPLPVNPPGIITPFTVGCALPPFTRHRNTSPTLDDYINEIRSLPHATNTLILWPEGALSFHSLSERNSVFKDIQEKIPNNNNYWAVSFDETILNTADNSSHTSLSRTGVALLTNSTDVPPVYYKRNLVPIAESFPLTPGSSPPPLYTIQLQHPKGINKPDWGPPPDFTRSLTLTASICLDFAMPSPFQDLESMPALILAPARTWDSAIGVRMWEEVKQRANEIGSLALWCDGGKGGVSGVAGSGYNEIFQVGEGSWSRTIGIKYPFTADRTFYARWGDAFVFGASWLFVIGPPWLWIMLSHSSRVSVYLQPVVAGIRSVTRKREMPPTLAAPQENLIEFGE